MAGIYIHIPFCRQACYYCDFYFTTQLRHRPELVKALCKELVLQKNYLEGLPIHTIYFGGGTPSVLTRQELKALFETIKACFPVVNNPEITLEANPDDLNEKKLFEMRSQGINRLSIGVQSFHGPTLKYLNRSHNEQQALNSLFEARKQGFQNINLDLIYGIPGHDHIHWRNDLEKTMAFKPSHLSAYCLTIENRTVFGNWYQKGKLIPVDDDFSVRQLEMLQEISGRYGYEQYEISNFALPKYQSQHNSNYWMQVPYLGIGPGAHSYNGKIRQFNVRNLAKYLGFLEIDRIPCQIEVLQRKDHINEYIMNSLRTKSGCNLKKLKEEYDFDLINACHPQLDKFKKLSLITYSQQLLRLTDKGKLLADTITSEFFQS
ncbi:MAG: radical SAM family heme chaperone HemW [Bacteroidetes bacterium]|nr:radical SAM family heme chaperone HemW [Bacteroidota bacterium]